MLLPLSPTFLSAAQRGKREWIFWESPPPPHNERGRETKADGYVQGGGGEGEGRAVAWPGGFCCDATRPRWLSLRKVLPIPRRRDAAEISSSALTAIQLPSVVALSHSAVDRGRGLWVNPKKHRGAMRLEVRPEGLRGPLGVAAF